jgi:hypothetical protein
VFVRNEEVYRFDFLKEVKIIKSRCLSEMLGSLAFSKRHYKVKLMRLLCKESIDINEFVAQLININGFEKK